MTQIPFPFSPQTLLTEDDFFVSSANEKAYHVVTSWPDWPSIRVLIYGGRASGKSHLLAMWSNMTQAFVIDGARLHHEKNFPEGAKAIALDNIDCIEDENLLFHWLNLAKSLHIPLLATAQKPQWSVTLPDLDSRLKAFTKVGILAPDDTLVQGVLNKLFSDRQLRPKPNVMGYLVPRLDRDFLSLQQMVQLIDTLSLAGQRPITRELVFEAFNQFGHKKAVDSKKAL